MPKGISKNPEITKSKMRARMLGNKLRIGKPSWNKGKTSWSKGLHFTEDHCEKISESRIGNKNPNWKGGITPINKVIRMSREYELWRQAVFERDNYTCVLCGQYGGQLEADHIKPFALFPELIFAIDNGRTLCKPCHKLTDTYGNKKQKENVQGRNC